jgi:transcriptional regulator with XRE-family HTH domain
MKLTSELSDTALLHEMGSRLARRRIDANLTQAQLAEEAGVSKSTVERLEAGVSTDSVMLVRVLRALKLIDALEGLIPDQSQSPITLLKQKGRERQRAGHPRGKAGRGATLRKPSAPWKWGE